MTSTLTPGPGAGPASPGPPPKRPFGLARHSLALARRSLIKIRRTPEGLADAMVLPVVFLAMFVYLFGGAVSGSTHAYLQRIFPAAMMMTVVMAGTMTTGFTLNADIRRGIFDRFRSLPIGRSAPLIGSVVGDMIRYLVALAVLFGFGYLLGFRAQSSALPVLAACALAIAFAFCLSWGYVLIGVVVREPGGVQGIAIVSLFPLVFGTDLVAPVKTMPGWLQAWVKVNPLTHAMDACRALLLGGPAAAPVITTLLWSVGLLAMFAPLAVHAYQRRA
jgi:oleandomycin transport system permease protein